MAGAAVPASAPQFNDGFNYFFMHAGGMLPVPDAAYRSTATDFNFLLPSPRIPRCNAVKLFG